MNTETRYNRRKLVQVLGIALCFSIITGVTLSAKAQQDHADHDGHDEHKEKMVDEHAGHDEHGDEHAGHADEGGGGGGLRLTAEQRKRFRIELRAAGAGSLKNEISLPGEIVFNEDRVVHMVPRVSGIVRKVTKSVGDSVKAGEVVASIDSRELADAKAEYLAADAREILAEKTFVREKTLRDKEVSSEQDFLEAEQSLAEARITLRSAEQKLHALGLSEKDVAALGEEHDEAITRYEIRSPIDGVVTEKHLSLGESLAADADIFTVADTASVWVNLTVYTKDLGSVEKGQELTLKVDHDGIQVKGRVHMVTPFVDEATRSATARVIVDNSDGRLIPGTFVTGLINVSEENIRIVVPKGAVQFIEGRSVVFVEDDGSFEMLPVTTGRADRNSVEILTGLKEGTRYVAKGSFNLKATAITSALGSHAGHGH